MRLGRFFGRNRIDREQREEMESYVQIETDENVARGMSYRDARAAAQRKLGNRTLIREEVYRMNTIGLLDTIGRNLRYSLRVLRNNPGFATTALLTLGIGIGANSAVFSVVNSVLIKPLAYPHSDELVSLRQLAPGAPGLASFSNGLPLSGSMYFTYADHNRTFRSLGVWVPTTASVTGKEEPEQVRVATVSDGVLQALNVSPAAGRSFSAADQLPHATPSILLSYGYWQKHFGGDPSAIGKTLKVDSRPRLILGVMPKHFRLVDTDFDLIAPLALDRSKETLAGFGYQGIGRLKPGITIARANQDIARLLPVWMDSWSNVSGGHGRYYETWRITPAFRTLKDEVVGNMGQVLWVVMGTLAIVMLIACANVANLLMVRTESRQQELAVRTALGAAHGRLIGELLTESLLLGISGGLFGIGLAYAGLRLLVAIGPQNLPRLTEISLDSRVVLFTLALSIGSGLLFGAVPAFKFAGSKISMAIRSAGRNASMSRERHQIRNLLVVTQVALALVLLISAGLMIRTFSALRNVRPGFDDPSHLQTMRISIPESAIANPELVTRTQNLIVDKLSRLPGVTSASFGSDLAMEGYGSMWDEVRVRDQSSSTSEPPMRYYKYVAPGFFQTAGTALLAGRDITWNDIYGHRPVVLISENFAREVWGSPGAAIGKQLREFASMPWHEVIGVVEDVRENGVQEKAPSIVYWSPLKADLFGPGPLNAWRNVTVLVRSNRAGTEGLLSEMRHATWSVNGSLPLAAVRTMQEIYAQSLTRTSFTLSMLAIAGAMALVLGLVGIYGVISYAVSQRRREIGIRLALGAEQGEVQGMFVRSGLRLAAVGCVLGLVSALAVTRLLQSLLFGIGPFDPVTYISVPLVLTAATMLASYVPARRAAAVDPAEMLRSE